MVSTWVPPNFLFIDRINSLITIIQKRVEPDPTDLPTINNSINVTIGTITERINNCKSSGVSYNTYKFKEIITLINKYLNGCIFI